MCFFYNEHISHMRTIRISAAQQMNEWAAD